MQFHDKTIFHTVEWGKFLEKILHGKIETIESEKGLLPIFRGSSIPLADYCGPVGDVAIPDGVEVFSLKKLPGFKESPFCTFKLVIGGKSYEEILKHVIHQKTRNMINKAVREGVHVYKVELNKKHLSAYYRLYVSTMLRLNRVPLPMKAFSVLPNIFGEKVELYLAEYNGKFIGGIISFVYNGVSHSRNDLSDGARNASRPSADGRMHIWSNASASKLSGLGVNNALYAYAIERASELKLNEVDFGSSAIGSSHHFFKKRFGGIETPIYCNHEIDADVRAGMLVKLVTFIMKFLPISLVSFLSRIAHKTSFRSVFKIACGIFLPLFLLFLISPLLIFNSGKKQIYTDINLVPNYEVAIVFGAGIKDDGTPSDALKDRLVTAAQLYDSGKVEKILVSGDNSLEHYDEPTAMYTYLVDSEGIPAEDVFVDFAGRRTYDTCVRAHEIWGVDEAILISQGFHLPRAIFTCNALGVDSSGYSATNQSYVLSRYYKFREVLAIYNAVIDVYLWGPDYIGGEIELDLDN